MRLFQGPSATRDFRPLQSCQAKSSRHVVISAPIASLWCSATASRMHHASIHPSLFSRPAVPDSRADRGIAPQRRPRRRATLALEVGAGRDGRSSHHLMTMPAPTPTARSGDFARCVSSPSARGRDRPRTCSGQADGDLVFLGGRSCTRATKRPSKPRRFRSRPAARSSPGLTTQRRIWACACLNSTPQIAHPMRDSWEYEASDRDREARGPHLDHRRCKHGSDTTALSVLMGTSRHRL